MDEWSEGGMEGGIIIIILYFFFFQKKLAGSVGFFWPLANLVKSEFYS